MAWFDSRSGRGPGRGSRHSDVEVFGPKYNHAWYLGGQGLCKPENWNMQTG